MRPWTRLIGLLLLLVGITGPTLAQDIFPISEDVFYTIRPGDTLDTIGALFDMSPRCIAAQNELERISDLRPGVELLLSVTCPRYAEDPTYLPTSPVLNPRLVVRVEECAGVRASYSDTVANLARLLSVDEDALRTANDLGPDEEPGYQQCLVLPALAAGTDGQGGGGGLPDGEFYVISFGETVYGIAMARNVSVEMLKIVNNIDNSFTIKAGTTLFIPADAPAFGEYPAMFRLAQGDGQGGGIAGEEYVMQPGDTLDAIAQEMDVSLISLMMANNIENSFAIQAGTVIIIPAGAARYGEFPPTMQADGTLGQGGGGPNEYVVQPGDYPQKIAREFNVDLITFMDVNGIDNSFTLMPGTVLVIPIDAPPFSEDGIPPVSVRSNTSGSTTPITRPTTMTNTTTGTDTIAPATQAAPAATQVMPTPTPETLATIPAPMTTEAAPQG